MRASMLLLVLLATLPAAAADAPETPATVVEQRLEVIVDSSRRLKSEHRWSVRIDDPARSSAGVPAPGGLDGASDQGAMVLDDLLVVPSATAPGTTLSLTAKDRQSRGPWSGVFRTAADLPVTHASARIQVPSWVGATVWFDPRGTPSYGRTRYTRAAEITWDGLPAGTPAELVWSTWKSWDEAGAALSKVAAGKLADKQGLGRELAADIQGVSVAELVDRVNQAVTVYPEDYGSWDDAREAVEVTAAGEGTAADRGVVLLSVLRVAGYDARPALFRPASPTPGAPLVVPAPAPFTRPAVAVVSEKRVVWIDPASTYTAVPDLPASMAGAVAWAAGRLPVPLASQGAMDGLVIINAQLRVEDDGEAAWSAQISASGTASEWLRTRLAPLGEEGRETALLRMIRQGRPGLERFTVSISGVENPQRSLKITVQGHDDAAVAALGPGMKGTIPPVLAPGLASWLPTRILVHEELAIDPPPGLSPVATVPAIPAYHPELVLAQALRQTAGKLLLVTEAERPLRDDTPARAAEAARFLEQHAPDGPQILWFGMPSPTLAKEIRADPRFGSPAERFVTETLLWLSVDDLTRARKTLKKALVTESAAALATELRRYATPGDAAPWAALYAAGKLPGTLIEATEGLAEAGETRDAWLSAAELSLDPDPVVQVRALRLMYQLQPEQQPDEKIDPAGNAAWLPRQDILTRAHEASRAVSDTSIGGDVPILLTKARRDLEHGRADEALVLLERVLAAGPNPVALVLHARARTRLGVAAQDLADEIEAGVREAPFDAEVLGEAARAMAAVGRNAEAASYAMAAARLGFIDPRAWADAARFALASGDLPTAAYAARRASDLAPEDAELGELLRRMATWIGDQEAATVGASRAGRAVKRSSWPTTFDDLLETTPTEALLAVLQYHEEEVAAKQRWLVTRGQLRLEAGLLDGAAQDGVLLASRHGDPRGHALAFAATAGRLWTSTGAEVLAGAEGNLEVRATRMEYALVSADGDALADAKALADDDLRAAAIVRATRDPAATAAEVDGWPAGLADPAAKGPPGWSRNAVFAAPAGILAWSHPDLAAALLLVDAPDDVLPPVIWQLWTPRRPDEATLPGGGRLFVLEGGNLPVYAATAPVAGRRVWALAFTPEGARRALDLGAATWSDGT